MNVMHPRLLPLWLILLVPVAMLAWLLGGPFLLERRVEMDVTARHAGEGWSLEWLDRKGQPINGRHLDLALADPAGAAATAHLESPLSHERFSTLLLQWRGMPGVEVDDPKNAVLVDRVLWWTTRTPLERRHGFIEGVERKDGVHRSATPDGGIAWAMPFFTMAMLADVLVVYALLSAGLLVVFTAYHIKDGRGWYTPERAAMLLVLGVHAWLAVRSPFCYCPDSMDYLINTRQLVEQGSWNQFNTLRLPGYSVFTAPMVAWLHDFGFGIGVAQAALAAATAWMAGRIAAAFVPGGRQGNAWAALVVLLVGLDPVLITYERLAMPESVTAFFCALTALIAVRRRFWIERGSGTVAAGAAGLGLLLAAACYVRGNMTLAAAIIPLAAALWAVVGPERPQWRRAVLITTAAWLTAGAAITPWLVYMHGKYGRVGFVIATGYGRCVSLLDTQREDLNQTAVFGRDRWKDLAARRADGRLNGHQTMAEVGLQEGTRVSAQVRALHSWTAKNDAAGVIGDETAERDPELRWVHCLRALSMQLALWPIEPVWMDNQKWSGPLRGEPARHGNWWTQVDDYKHFKRELTEDIYERAHKPVENWQRSDESEVFSYWCSLASMARPLWAALFVLGVLGALSRRRWVLLMLGLMALGHACVLAFHVFTGIDRYQVPMYPLMSVMVVYAIACLAGAAPIAPVAAPDAPRSRTERV